MPPLNIYRNTTLMSNSTRASTFAPYFELTPSLTERPLVFTLIIFTTDFHPASPAAPRRSTFTNINTAITITNTPPPGSTLTNIDSATTITLTPAPSELCPQDETAVTQDRSGAPAAPPSWPLSRAHTTAPAPRTHRE